MQFLPDWPNLKPKEQEKQYPYWLKSITPYRNTVSAILYVNWGVEWYQHWTGMWLDAIFPFVKWRLLSLAILFRNHLWVSAHFICHLYLSRIHIFLEDLLLLTEKPTAVTIRKIVSNPFVSNNNSIVKWCKIYAV